MKRTVLKQLPNQLRRLVILKRFFKKNLEKIEGHFNMSHWTHHIGGHSLRERGEAFEAKDLVDCGTVACLAGWAATIPQLRKEGLVVKVCRKDEISVSGEILYQNSEGSEACRQFFGTSRPFRPETYRGAGNASEVLLSLESRVDDELKTLGFKEPKGK